MAAVTLTSYSDQGLASAGGTFVPPTHPDATPTELRVMARLAKTCVQIWGNAWPVTETFLFARALLRTPLDDQATEPAREDRRVAELHRVLGEAQRANGELRKKLDVMTALAGRSPSAEQQARADRRGRASTRGHRAAARAHPEHAVPLPGQRDRRAARRSSA